MTFLAQILMIAVCVQEGYEADYWLAVVISAAPGMDCSTDARLISNMNRLEKEQRGAHRELKPESVFLFSQYCYISTVLYCYTYCILDHW